MRVQGLEKDSNRVVTFYSATDRSSAAGATKEDLSGVNPGRQPVPGSTTGSGPDLGQTSRLR